MRRRGALLRDWFCNVRNRCITHGTRVLCQGLQTYFLKNTRINKARTLQRNEVAALCICPGPGLYGGHVIVAIEMLSTPHILCDFAIGHEQSSVACITYRATPTTQTVAIGSYTSATTTIDHVLRKQTLEFINAEVGEWIRRKLTLWLMVAPSPNSILDKIALPLDRLLYGYSRACQHVATSYALSTPLLHHQRQMLAPPRRGTVQLWTLVLHRLFERWFPPEVLYQIWTYYCVVVRLPYDPCIFR